MATLLVGLYMMALCASHATTAKALTVTVTVHTANSDSCGMGDSDCYDNLYCDERRSGVSDNCAGTKDDVTVAYGVDGYFTSPLILCHGLANCSPDDTASSSTTLTEMPTKMRWVLDGPDPWLFDSVSLDVDGKTCTLLSSGSHEWFQGNCMDGDATCGDVKTFDLQSSCPMFVFATTHVTVKVHTANSDSCGSGYQSCAGTTSDVIVAYEVAGSFTSTDLLCNRDEYGRGNDCSPDEYAKLSTALTEMPTKMRWKLESPDRLNAWLFDSVSLDVNGKTCTLLCSGTHAYSHGGNCMDGDGTCGDVKTFDLQSSCPGLFATPPQSEGCFMAAKLQAGECGSPSNFNILDLSAASDQGTSSVSSVTFPIFIAALSSATAVALAAHTAVLHRRIADLKHGSLLLG